jgi:hypothetical protein
MSASATGTKERAAREQRARGNGKNGPIKSMEEIGLGGLLPGTPIGADVVAEMREQAAQGAKKKGGKGKPAPEPEAPKKGKGKGKPAPEPEAEPEAPKRIRKPKPEPEPEPKPAGPEVDQPATDPAPEVNPAPSVPEPAQDAPAGSPDGSPERPAESPQVEPGGPPAGTPEAPGAWGPPVSSAGLTTALSGIVDPTDDDPVEMRPLTPEEAARLATYEARAGMGFREIGLSFAAIKAERLYIGSHSTFREYVADVWGYKRRAADSYIAGALEVERLIRSGVAPEDVPRTEYGARVLTMVPEAEREGVLREANEAARKNGKQRAGSAEIIAASEGKKRGRPPGSPNKSKGDEPREVARARANGTIPEDGPVTVIEVGAGEPDEIETPEEIFDRAKYLDQFPIREHLGKDPLAIFDASAMTYHSLSAPRLLLVSAHAHPAFEAERKATGGLGPYAARLRRALMTGDPSTWTLCETCTGAATVEILGTVKPCTDCHRNGFKIP